VETVVAERLPLSIQLRWMEAVNFFQKFAKDVIILGTFLKSAAQKVAIILSTFTGEAMKSANHTLACLKIF
jgi:hypothetical protein